jgi:CRP-like cAMP-binding protein
MSDHSPFLMHRMLALRQFPLFAHADLSELAMVAENVVERSFATGGVVAPAERLTSLHLILDGQLEVGELQLGARSVHGSLEVAARRPARAPAIALAPTRTLELDASDYFEILEDNFGLLLATIRDLAARVIPLGDLHRRFTVPTSHGTVGLVERMILLRQHIPFSGARLEALAILAHAAVEARWAPGEILKRANARADGSLIIIEGAVRAGDRMLGPGHAIGVLETLAGIPHRETFEAATPVRALQSHAATILDVLEDHTDFALTILETFARALLDHESRIVCATRSDGADLAQDPRRSWPYGWRAS